MDGFRQTLSGLVSFFIKTVGKKDEETGVITLNICRAIFGIFLFSVLFSIFLGMYGLLSYGAIFFNVNVIAPLIPFDISFLLPSSEQISQVESLKDAEGLHVALLHIYFEGILLVQLALSIFFILISCIVLYRVNKFIGKVYIPITAEVYEAFYDSITNTDDEDQYKKELKKRQELYENFSYFERFYYSFLLDSLSFDKTAEKGVGISVMSGLLGMVVFSLALMILFCVAFIVMLFTTAINRIIIDEMMGYSFLNDIFVGEGILINKIAENAALFALQPLITFGAAGVIYFSFKWVCAKLGSVSFSIDPDSKELKRL